MPTTNIHLKEAWTAELFHTHDQLMEYVETLDNDELLWCEEGRWNAGQQVQHVHLCLAAISQALASKAFIEQTFGRIDRPTLSYDEVIERYKSGLSAGGRSPERFVPGYFEAAQKEKVLAELRGLLQTIKAQLESYSDEECDTLVLPHPFVGKLTIRELFCLMTEHAKIHQASIEKGLHSRAKAATL